jgi:hypothetical protein
MPYKGMIKVEKGFREAMKRFNIYLILWFVLTACANMESKPQSLAEDVDVYSKTHPETPVKIVRLAGEIYPDKGIFVGQASFIYPNLSGYTVTVKRSLYSDSRDNFLLIFYEDNNGERFLPDDATLQGIVNYLFTSQQRDVQTARGVLDGLTLDTAWDVTLRAGKLT